MTTYRSVAASVAQDKAAHPERYCPENRCLWRTDGGGYCPRHRDPSKPDDRPRATYLLPDGRTVEKAFPRGTTPPETTTYTYLLGKGRTVTVTRIDEEELRRTAGMAELDRLANEAGKAIQRERAERWAALDRAWLEAGAEIRTERAAQAQKGAAE